MSASLSVSGRCMCGAVRFTALALAADVMACHCSLCRRWAGGIGLYLDVDAPPVFTGKDKVGVYKSSDWGERGFCTQSGSSLYWKVAGDDRYAVSAGALDDPSHLRLTKEIFIDDKPGYYTFANDTVKQTGDEAAAAFLAEQARNYRT